MIENKSHKTKLAFFGTPELTISILDELEQAGMKPDVIITSPDKRQGRKMLLTSPAPKMWAKKNNIPVLQPEKLDSNFWETLRKIGVDLGIVVAYGKILPQELIDLPKLGMWNIHYSLLPKYRGATPVESAILNGDTKTGVCIQKMVFELDAGDVVATKEVSIEEKETAPDLRLKLNEIAKGLLVETIRKIITNTITLKKQSKEEATFCKKIKKEDGLIDLNNDPYLNYRKYRAYFNWPGSYFFADRNGKKIRIIIKSARLDNGKFLPETVIPEGKKEIAYSDFLKSYKLD